MSTPDEPGRWTAPRSVAADVAVNLLWCVPGAVGGSEQYLVRQLRGMLAVPQRPSFTLYVLPGLVAAHPFLADVGRVVTAPFSGRSRPLRVAAEHSWLAWRDRHADLVHHGGGTVPAIGRRPAVLTIHDLQYLDFPQYFSRLKHQYLVRRMPRSVARATVITVPSEFVRTTVIEAFAPDAERVVVVPHGVEPDIGRRATPADLLRVRYGIGDRRIVILPAATFPHKGHMFLLRLLAERWTDPHLCLVLTGGAGLAEAEVAAEIERLGLSKRVLRLGRVSGDDRDGLIRMAEALVLPSQYEGFGAPLIEAMSLGTPIVASDVTAVPEVVGDAGLCLPLDIDAWGPALELVAGRRGELVAAGVRRAQRYSCERSAAALLGAYGVALP